MATKVISTTDKAYQHCVTIAEQHYENFVVVAKFLPKQLKRPIAAIYAYARYADDLADEGDLSETERLAQLQKLWHQVDCMPTLKTNDLMLIALQDVVVQYSLPKQLLLDLLIAFRQDVTKHDYQDFAQVLEYCKYSANPIGRMLLHLAGFATKENNELADNICTGLQLFNFLQDVSSDLLQRKRCYIPVTELQSFGVSLEDLKNTRITTKVNKLIAYQVKRASDIFSSGVSLGNKLPGAFGLEIRMIIMGGRKICSLLSKRTDPYARPVVSKLDKFNIFFQALMGGKL